MSVGRRSGARGRIGGIGLASLTAGLLCVLASPAPSAAAPAKVAAKLEAARAPVAELRRIDAVPLPGGAVLYRFRQEVWGFDVLGGEAVVDDAPGAPPSLVADATKPAIEAPPPPRVGRGRAMAIATRDTAVRGLRGRAKARLAIEPGAGGTLAWRVMIPSARPLADFEVLVDAVTGDVLRVRDLLQDFRTGHAKLYDPNPVVENGGFDGLDSDENDGDTSLLTSLRLPVSLPRVKSGQTCLRGRWAHAQRGGAAHEVCRRGVNWRSVKRSQNSFEALMAYYHVDRAQRYIHKLGFSDAHGNGIDDRSQVVVANALADDNSFYSSASRKIFYGTGGVDDAEDADVILHEYGHAMQDSQAPGFLAGTGYQAGSLAEGSGDYWAAVMSSRSPGTTNVDDVCIFEWDGLAWGDLFQSDSRYCGRRADNPQTFAQQKGAPIDCSSVDPTDIHCGGAVWSSALWDLRGAIGAATMDRIHLASQFMYTASERFKTAAGALVTADQDLTGGLNKSAICTEMETDRGLNVPGCP